MWHVLLIIAAVGSLSASGWWMTHQAAEITQFNAALPPVADLMHLRQFVKSTPRDARLHLLLAQSYLHFNHNLSALDEYNQALRLRGDEWQIESGSAITNRALMRYDRAAVNIQRLIQLKPNLLEP